MQHKSAAKHFRSLSESKTIEGISNMSRTRQRLYSEESNESGISTGSGVSLISSFEVLLKVWSKINFEIFRRQIPSNVTDRNTDQGSCVTHGPGHPRLPGAAPHPKKCATDAERVGNRRPGRHLRKRRECAARTCKHLQQLVDNGKAKASQPQHRPAENKSLRVSWNQKSWGWSVLIFCFAELMTFIRRIMWPNY